MIEAAKDLGQALPLLNLAINVWLLQKVYSLIGKVGQVEGKVTVICTQTEREGGDDG